MEPLLAVICVMAGCAMIYLGIRILGYYKKVNEVRAQIPQWKESVQEVNHQLDIARVSLDAFDEQIAMANEFSENFNSLYEGEGQPQ